MKIEKLLLPTVALGLASVVLTPDTATGFLKFNFSLNTNQRTVRVYNNFTAAGANNNTTPHPMFPGHVGAELALWKAAVEWGSEPHGDGSGDPTQPVLGSGGANFDAHFVGNATGSGQVGHNVMSQLGGCSGGTFAFMQGGAGGWRIYFYQCWSWADGPGAIGGGQADLQGIGVHEYGHGLGLGHSNIFQATMFSSTSTGVTATRSIHSDDIAGLQCKYGVKSATKPHIENITGGNTITITGTHFAPNVEVWFPRLDPTPPNQKVSLIVSGLTSNGTTITVGWPTGAAPGDILVRNSGTNQGAGLSNAFPFEPEACAPAFTYCTPKDNTCGPGTIGFFGQPSASSSFGFFVTGANPLGGKLGVLLYNQGAGPAPPYVPFGGNGNGVLCMTIQSVKTTRATGSGGNPGQCGNFAEFLIDMNAYAAGSLGGFPAPYLSTPGETVHCQWWGRETSDSSYLSDGAQYVVCP